MDSNLCLENVLHKYGALESSQLIDLSLFDDWPLYAGSRIEPWDLLGVLKSAPVCRDLGCNAFQWSFTLYQTETDYMNIEFNSYSSVEEPKFQQLEYYRGAIIYIRHLKPYEPSISGLYAPYGRLDVGRPHWLHRTIYALDPTMKELRDFENVSKRLSLNLVR